MKLIHCADLHLDSPVTRISDERLAKARHDELLQNFPRMVEYAHDQEVKAILIAGDFFDKNIISKLAENIVLGTIRNNSGIMFYYVPGNHDSNCFLAGLTDKPRNLVVFGEEIQTMYIPGSNNITVSSVKITEKNESRFYDDMHLPASAINILMLHGMLSSNQNRGLHIRQLQGKNIDYLALGDIHKPIFDKLDQRGTLCYPGCLEGRGFDECGEHGFMLLDIDEEAREIKTLFVDFAKRHYHEINVDCDGAASSDEIIRNIETELKNTEISKDDFVKFVLVGRVNALAERDLDFVAKCFDGYASEIIVDSKLEKYIDFSEFRNDPSFAGEFVRTVEKQELPEEDKVKIIEMGLTALKGEKI